MKYKTFIEAWHSRGYLPHFDQSNLIQSITFRLDDAVPEIVIESWKKELAWSKRISASHPRQIELRKRIDKYEDAGYGACWLRNNNVAAIVQGTLLYFDAERYRIIAWCIMPNHVHAIAEILDGYSLSKIIHSWKSYSSQEANKILERSGTFWFREYFDRYIRDDMHLAAAIDYIENNPVKAGLVTAKEKWPWSSAWKHSH
jgi:REP element-mobilizing transposase RayT